MTRILAILLSVLLGLWPTAAVWAQSGGNCAIFKSWGTTETLTASDLNTSFTTVGVTNVTQACIDGISDSVAGMQTQTTPYTAGAESQATSGAGELERLRYVLSNVFGLTFWYRRDQNIDFATGTEIQGAGLGRHVTAVGLHTWSGSQRFPAITSVLTHTSGIFWPAAHHMALAFDPAVDADKAGVETFRFHVQALTLHHTAALRFWHSTGGSTATGHITAISVSRGLVSAAGNEAAGRDTLLFGHASAVIQMVGYGASHIALGARSYVHLDRHVGTLSPAVPVINALYADTIPKVWGQTDAGVTLSDSFGVASIQRPDTGQYIITWERPFSNTVYVLIVTGINVITTTVVASIESQATTHAVVRTTIAGAGAFNAGVNFVGFGRQ